MLRSFRKPVEARPRIARLAQLPIFFKMDGRTVVVAGSSDAAAWKVELLAAAGATVRVFAASPGSELGALIAQAAPGTIELVSRSWLPADLPGAALAIADAACETEAAAFCSAARLAGVPVSVIDRPTHGDFQFGAIVNRSPLVIGISTDGAAPIIAQAIRRRIETLLPAHLSQWLAMAKVVREQVMRLIPDKPGRRAFWGRLAEAAFLRRPPAEAAALIDEFAGFRRPGRKAGHVTLVGAGPGDAELLTLKAVRALQSADVILFDDLVSTDVLELARREAKRLMVGKRGGKASCRQDDINRLMIKLARQGKRVVRLKSGDPMIFGRAGEEIAELEAAGITVAVVPGITAGLAAAAALGISLTHRELAQSVRFVTAHSSKGGLPEKLDWRSMADPATSLVVYMGGKMARPLARRLIAEGLAGGTPVGVLASLSRPEERRVFGDLEGLAQGTLDTRHDGPVLICIGRAFGQATRKLISGTEQDRAAG